MYIASLFSRLFQKRNRRRPKPTDWVGLTIVGIESVLSLMAISLVSFIILTSAYVLAGIEVKKIEECSMGPAWDYTERCEMITVREWSAPW